MPKTPSNLDIPSFLVNFPFTVDNRVINNALMKSGPYNKERAYSQWMTLYNQLTEDALVYILPSQGDYQDQPYVANLGAYLPHKNILILSNFKSEPRRGEEEVGRQFFQMMGYYTNRPSTYFEGEADLKYLRDNIYIGGHGMRTDIETYRWMTRKYDMKIIGIEMNDPKLYHMDCMVMPLTTESILAATSAIDPADLKKLEQVCQIVDVPNNYLYDGWTNSIRIGQRILHWPKDTQSCHAFQQNLTQLNFEIVPVDLSEFEKSGADLSCLVMHLNYKCWQ